MSKKSYDSLVVHSTTKIQCHFCDFKLFPKEYSAHIKNIHADQKNTKKTCIWCFDYELKMQKKLVNNYDEHLIPCLKKRINLEEEAVAEEDDDDDDDEENATEAAEEDDDDEVNMEEAAEEENAEEVNMEEAAEEVNKDEANSYMFMGATKQYYKSVPSQKNLSRREYNMLQLQKGLTFGNFMAVAERSNTK